MRLFKLSLTALIALASACATAAPSGHPQSVAKTAEALKAVKSGGYVLVLRHGVTEPDEADTDPLHLDDCANQRLLSDQGRIMASGIGKRLAEAGAKMDKIVSSRYCRAIETAQRTGFGPIITTDDVSEAGQVVSPNENKRRIAALQKLTSTTPPKGMNTLIVTHRPNVLDAFGPDFYNVTEGELLIFEPTANGAKLRWRITPRDFSNYQNQG